MMCRNNVRVVESRRQKHSVQRKRFVPRSSQGRLISCKHKVSWSHLAKTKERNAERSRQLPDPVCISASRDRRAQDKAMTSPVVTRRVTAERSPRDQLLSVFNRRNDPCMSRHASSEDWQKKPRLGDSERLRLQFHIFAVWVSSCARCFTALFFLKVVLSFLCSQRLPGRVRCRSSPQLSVTTLQSFSIFFASRHRAESDLTFPREQVRLSFAFVSSLQFWQAVTEESRSTSVDIGQCWSWKPIRESLKLWLSCECWNYKPFWIILFGPTDENFHRRIFLVLFDLIHYHG